MKVLFSRFALAALLALSGISLGAGQFAVVAQETDDPVKIQIYQRFRDNYQRNPDAAYQAARDYLQKYQKDKDQYTDYLSKWVAAYERDDRLRDATGVQRLRSGCCDERRACARRQCTPRRHHA